MMKTGRGKTFIIFNLIEIYPVSTLILCHNIKQAYDTYEKIQACTNVRSESDLALITSKSKQTETKVITVTTHKNFVQNFQNFKEKFQQIIYDECDFNLSFPKRSEYDGCMSSCLIMSGCDLIRGLSGTPYKANLGPDVIHNLFGELIYMPGQKNNGYNLLPSITQLVYGKSYGYTRDTWSDLRNQMIDDENRISTQIDTILKYKQDKTLLLLEMVREVDKIYNLLQETKHGTTLIKIHGQMGDRELRESRQTLHACTQENKPYLIVTNVDMMGRGIDIPEIGTVLFFAPVKFEGTLVQAVGRCLRACGGKEEAYVYDWLDLPLLTKQAKEREKSYKREYTKDVKIQKIYL